MVVKGVGVGVENGVLGGGRKGDGVVGGGKKGDRVVGGIRGGGCQRGDPPPNKCREFPTYF